MFIKFFDNSGNETRSNSTDLLLKIINKTIKSNIPKTDSDNLNILIIKRTVDSNEEGFLTYVDNTFIIFLSDHVRPWTMRKNLRHELYHLLQIKRGDLAISESKDIFWKGKQYVGIEYWRQPWEKEAFENQNYRY